MPALRIGATGTIAAAPGPGSAEPRQEGWLSRRRNSSARLSTLAAVLVVLFFIGWALAELFVVIKVAEAIGVVVTIVLLIAGWPLGIWALRSQGRAAWQRLTVAVSEARPPGREVADGALVVVGGTLLMIPGFITDVAGICALFPPTRALLRRLLIHNFRSRVMVRAAGFGRQGYDVDSTAKDLDQPRLQP